MLNGSGASSEHHGWTLDKFKDSRKVCDSIGSRLQSDGCCSWQYASIDHVVVAMVADIFLCAAWNTVERGDIE
jgi:hypothetical protein